jgi:general secretion pathway protein F
MAKFRYTAVDAAGKRSRGIIEAASASVVADRLRRQRFLLLRADEVSEKKSFLDVLHLDLSVERGLSKAVVAQFTRELSVMLGAGQDVDHALRFLVDTTENKRARAVLQNLRDKVRGGKSLAASLADCPAVFSKLYVSLVRAGEMGGRLGDALGHLADLLEREMKLQSSIQSAMTYPALLVLASAATITLLLTYVLPQFTPIFAQAGAQLPFTTRLLIGAGDVLRDYGLIMLSALLATVLILYRTAREERARLALERVTLSLPIVGDLIRRGQAARFTRTLGTLLRDGVGLVPALGIARGVLGNATAARLVDAATARVKSGARLGASLAEDAFFPPQTLHLILLGEETGRLADMSLRAADIHDDQVHLAVARIVSLLVPVITVVMGLVVAGIVGSLLTAMLSLNDLAL